MKIKKVNVKNFMIFKDIDMEFSPNINIICGENSSGKTALIKLLYACVKSLADAGNLKDDITKTKLEELLVSKFRGVFQPDKSSIGRLVNRAGKASEPAKITTIFDDETSIEINLKKAQVKHFDIEYSSNIYDGEAEPVYIPPKEIISSTENFTSLYEDYHIAIEETYYDLAKLLNRPKKRDTDESLNSILKSFVKIVGGNVSKEDKSFYLVQDSMQIEMGLVSEGYRKISTLMYLIQSGTLSKNSILFWDEPETNMNPKMIQPLVDAIIQLANIGVQVFITTHDYFIQQCFSMASEYANKENNLKYNFISLNKIDKNIKAESAESLIELEHNAIMEEFDSLYDREQGFIYDNF